MRREEKMQYQKKCRFGLERHHARIPEKPLPIYASSFASILMLAKDEDSRAVEQSLTTREAILNIEQSVCTMNGVFQSINRLSL